MPAAAATVVTITPAAPPMAADVLTVTAIVAPAVTGIEGAAPDDGPGAIHDLN
jgi:hypothetical protein